MRGNKQIVVTRADAHRLCALLTKHMGSTRDQEHLEELSRELERAHVLDSAQMPAGVVTMGSRVGVRDLATGERHEFVLVYPFDADVSENRVSVLAPLGTALLGYGAGDEVEWVMPGGPRRLLIEHVSASVLFAGNPIESRPCEPQTQARGRPSP